MLLIVFLGMSEKGIQLPFYKLTRKSLFLVQEERKIINFHSKKRL